MYPRAPGAHWTSVELLKLLEDLPDVPEVLLQGNAAPPAHYRGRHCLGSIHQSLVISLPKINLGEEAATRHLGGEIHHIWQRIRGWHCYTVETAIVPQGRHKPSDFFKESRPQGGGLAQNPASPCRLF